MSSRSKLASSLNLSIQELEKLSSDETYLYNSYTTTKGRDVQEPLGVRKKAHKKIFKWLQRIETPSYLFSGKKGVSAIHNGLYHQGANFVATMDIKKFYPSTTKKDVFLFFYLKLKMPKDIAGLLANLVTINNHIPTGSSLSQAIAYWAYSDVFDSIENYAFEKGFKFSLYVDDMTFSANDPISTLIEYDIRSILRSSPLKLGRKKTNFYLDTDFKKITGVVLSPDGTIKVANTLQKECLEIINKSHSLDTLSDDDVLRLIGKIRHGKQADKYFFHQVFLKLVERSKKITSQRSKEAAFKKKQREFIPHA